MKINTAGCCGVASPAEGAADKTAGKERTEGERLNEDLGARGKLPPPTISGRLFYRYHLLDLIFF